MNLALESKAPNISLGFPYQPHVKLKIHKAPYILKTADTSEELDAAFRLRAQVFFEESKNPAIAEYDCDEFDSTCDHIVIQDERTGTMVGTYRVRSTRFHPDFYSAHEFDLAPILRVPGEKMELGRAAVHRDFRNGSVISILWRGIAKYALLSNANYLFGCSSVFTTSPLEAARYLTFLERTGAVAESARTIPTQEFRMAGFQEAMQEVGKTFGEADSEEIKNALPTLFMAYLKMGAKVCGEPALDRDFNCIDFLTLLDLEKLSRMFRRFQD